MNNRCSIFPTSVWVVLPRTDTRTHAHARARTHTHTHIRTRTLTDAHVHTLGIDTHTRTQARTHIHTHTAFVLSLRAVDDYDLGKQESSSPRGVGCAEVLRTASARATHRLVHKTSDVGCRMLLLSVVRKESHAHLVSSQLVC